jgi:hypothetical protein
MVGLTNQDQQMLPRIHSNNSHSSPSHSRSSQSRKTKLKPGEMKVDVQGLVKLTNKLFSDCNTPWSHISGGTSVNKKRPTTTHSQVSCCTFDEHNNHEKRWHKNYIDAVLQQHTSIVKHKKRVVSILSERITGSSTKRSHEEEKPEIIKEFRQKVKVKHISLENPRINAAAGKDKRRNAIMDDGEGASVYQSNISSFAASSFIKNKSLRTNGPLNKLINILHKHPLGRSAKEKSFIFEQLRIQDAFKTIKNDILAQISGIINLNEYPDQNTVIFSQGDLGREWFVLLAGTLTVVVDSIIRGDIGAGTGFGELALMAGDGKRHATIITKSPDCVILYIVRFFLS